MTICRLVTAAEEPARRERYAAEPRRRSALKQGHWLARWTRAEKRQATRRQRAGGRISKFAARGSDTGLGSGGLPVRWAWAWALQSQAAAGVAGQSRHGFRQVETGRRGAIAALGAYLSDVGARVALGQLLSVKPLRRQEMRQ